MYTLTAIVRRGKALIIDCTENYVDTCEGLDPTERLKNCPSRESKPNVGAAIRVTEVVVFADPPIKTPRQTRRSFL
jgi:hypothetical protein